MVIDPNDPAGPLECLQRRGWSPELIFLTHEHGDHMAGLETLPLYRDEMVAVLPPQHPLAKRATVPLAELAAAQGELSLAYRQFDQALDPELVESCIYQISAVKARCNYLIRAIKERSPETAAAVKQEGDAAWT